MYINLPAKEMGLVTRYQQHEMDQHRQMGEFFWEGLFITQLLKTLIYVGLMYSDGYVRIRLENWREIFIVVVGHLATGIFFFSAVIYLGECIRLLPLVRYFRIFIKTFTSILRLCCRLFIHRNLWFFGIIKNLDKPLCFRDPFLSNFGNYCNQFNHWSVGN